jgi:osmotically-inducible protein OsmY
MFEPMERMMADRWRDDDDRERYGQRGVGPGGFGRRYGAGGRRDWEDDRIRRGREFGQDYYGNEYGGGFTNTTDRDRYDSRYDYEYDGQPTGNDYRRASRYGTTNWHGDLGRDDDRDRRRGYERDRDHDRDDDWWDRLKHEVKSWMREDGDDDTRRGRGRRSGHYGKGPRGYTRSDDRIREDVNDRLSDDWRVDASDIDVTVSSAEVTLNGTVNSREEKRRAEDLAEDVSGVRHVQNNLRVGQRSGDATTTTISGTNRASSAT